MKSLFFALFLVFSVIAQAQDYYVLQVKGNVKSTKTGKEIKTNDVIKPDDQLKFSAATDAVAVVSAKAGRFVLKPGKANKTNEFVAYVKDALSQANNRLSTRAGIFNNVIDFKTYFEKQIFLLPEQTFEVGKEAYPISNEAFFFIRYNLKGEEVNKQLPTGGGNFLVINRDELFKVDGQPINAADAKDFQLFYYSSQGAIPLTSLYFDLTDPKSVRQEIDVLQKAMISSNTSASKTIDEIIAYLQENYGKVEEGNVIKWLGLK